MRPALQESRRSNRWSEIFSSGEGGKPTITVWILSGKVIKLRSSRSKSQNLSWIFTKKPLEVKGDRIAERGVGVRGQESYPALSPPRQKYGGPGSRAKKKLYDKLVKKPVWMGNKGKKGDMHHPFFFLNCKRHFSKKGSTQKGAMICISIHPGDQLNTWAPP